MGEFSLELILALTLIAGLAGFLDAIAGGGGLLSVPALLAAGLSPVQVLATNKAQAVFGSFTAATHFVRQGAIDLRRIRHSIVLAFIGTLCGSMLVQQIPTDFLERIIPVLLILFAVYFMLTPKLGAEDVHHRVSEPVFALLIGFGIGFYDGFFGPGTGTFYAMGFVLLLGYNLTRATAGTKVLNFTSNLGALLVFIVADQVVWQLAIPMGLAQILGARLGAGMVLRHGAQLVRPLMVLVAVTISIKLLLQG